MTQKIVVSLVLSLLGSAAFAGGVKPIELLGAHTKLAECQPGVFCSDAKIGGERTGLMIDGTAMTYVVPDGETGAHRVYLEKAAPCADESADAPRDIRKLYVNEETGVWSESSRAVNACAEVPMT